MVNVGGKMRVLFFSDLHAHAFQAYSKLLPNGRNSRLQETLDILEEIRGLCNQFSVDGILFAGDMFHIRPGLGSMKIPTFNAVYDAIAKLKIGRKFVGLLVGNHDQGNKSGTEHSIHAFKSIVTVMDERTWYTFEANNEQICVFAVPASTDLDGLRKDIGEAKNYLKPNEDVVAKIMLGHLGIDGAEVGNNFRLRDDNVLSVGDLWPQDFDHVFLGDYHKPQKLASNVYYIGATHHHNWGDANQRRRVLLWDTESHEIGDIPLRSTPMFVKMQWEETETAAPSEIEGNRIRVLHIGPRNNADQNKVEATLVRLGASSVEFVREDDGQTIGNPETSTFTPSMDQESMIDAYVNSQDSDTDPDLLRRCGYAIFNKAMEGTE